MVGGDRVHRAVDDTGAERLAVCGRAYRRVHLETTFLLEVGVSEPKIVGTRLACHFHSARLGVADEINALLGRNVADMQTASRLFGQTYVAFDLFPFALAADSPVAVCCGVVAVMDIAFVEKRLDFTMGGEQGAGGGDPFHGFGHHLFRLDTCPVVRETGNSVGESREIDSLLAEATASDRSVGEDLNQSVVGDQLLLN